MAYAGGSEQSLESKVMTIEENGLYDIFPSGSAAGLTSVRLTVAVTGTPAPPNYGVITRSDGGIIVS